ncbi:MAG: Stk1 family PASTA domain-containing Ser/Thr kinase [Microthrixaceae bacterium]
MTSPRLSEETGRVLGGRYRLVAPVGVGTSSRVFLAVDTQLRRRVAVKLLHEALAEDEAFLRRFRAEARAAGALNHPNIVAVYDWGEDDSDGVVVPYLVTEYLGGGSLRDILDRGTTLSPSQTLLVGLETARALAHAHLRGLVHRDVKPGNLLFDEEGRLRLADFGLARALAEASWTEPSGALIGTARYASPEQSLGRRLDGRSDVYSLALVLVECVTGSVPFTGDTTASTLALRTQGDLELSASLGGLRSVLERAGRLEPDERPEAAEFEIGLMAAAEELARPEPLPVVATLGDGEETSELHLARELGIVRPRDVKDPEVLPDPPPVVLGQDPSAVSWSNGQDTGQIDDAELEAQQLLAASRPASFGRVEPYAVSPRPEGEPAPRRRGRTAKVLAVVLALALVVGGAAAWWFLIRVPVHDVPELIGLDVDAATAQAEELGYEVDASTLDRRDGTEPGEVLDQSPAPAEALEEGATVSLTVSLGPTLVALPPLAAMPEADATAALASAGLTLGTVQRANDEEVPVDVVISAAPAAGEDALDAQGQLPRGTVVDLTVSAGPAPRVVPDALVGATVDDARAALAAVQLEAAVGEEYSETVPAGYIVSSATAAGTELPRGSVVQLVMSIGPEPITVPDVRFVTGAMAEQRLVEAGLAVAGIEGPSTGMVLQTDPTPGEQVPRGTAVRIFTKR